MYIIHSLSKMCIDDSTKMLEGGRAVPGDDGKPTGNLV